MSKGWKLIKDDEGKNLTVYPIKDVLDHVEGGVCWCHPTSQDLDNEYKLYVHSSYDDRESIERLMAKAKGE